MPVDINQFIPAFIEESLEMLHSAESTLLSLELNHFNPEDIHKLFRYMHSIKGASAVFKFDVITKLAHTLENFLDKVRSENLSLSQDDINLLLKAIDCIEDIVINIQNKLAIDDHKAKELTLLFKEKLKPTHSSVIKNNKNELGPTIEAPQESPTQGWYIKFTPARDLFLQNIDPLNVFYSLSELGHTKIIVNIQKLLSFDKINPQECYFSWEIEILTMRSKNEVAELFAWIANEENVLITALADKNTIPQQDKISKPPIENQELKQQAKSQLSVRVSTEKIDHLINLIGELTITLSMLKQEMITNFNVNKNEKLQATLTQLENNSRELQINIMRMRMVPIDFIFNRFPRITHDVASKMNKEIQLVIKGEQTEIDKNMIEKISDPLVHLIRNAIDHGIELPDIRKLHNKPPMGMIQLNAYQEADNIIIDVTDDGAGLNKEKIHAKALSLHLLSEKDEITDDQLYQFIFHPGFSTSETITNISGRGVGLDVVYSNIHDLGGEIEISTVAGEGTNFRLRLPLTLAILDGQLVKINNNIFIIPLINIAEIIAIDSTNLNPIDHENNVYKLRNKFIPLIYLPYTFCGEHFNSSFKEQFIIVIEINNKNVGLVVKELLSQQPVVIKSLEDNLKLKGISGVTILGDGQIGFILDIKSIINQKAFQASLQKSRNIPQENIIENQNIFLNKINHHCNETFQFLGFTLANHHYGIDILSIKEIRPRSKETVLPNMPSYVKGIINVRGMIIPVIDLQNYFHIDNTIYSLQNIIIILTQNIAHKEHTIGILADKVLDTYTIQFKDINPVSDPNDQFQQYIDGFVTINNKIMTLINSNYINSIITTSTVIMQEMAK